MHMIRVRNVAAALPAGLAYLLDAGRPEESRAGPVLVAPGPVTTVYEQPCERVLFSAVRDANPFFHLAEALWMLAGRNDSLFLNHFIRDFGARFGEPHPGGFGLIHGAYGYRWRHALGFDQLDHVVEVLRRDPSSRQCVLQMWDAGVPEMATTMTALPWVSRGEPRSADLTGPWRDRPCNTHCYLRVRQVEDRQVLDLTVLCRSNDIIWGAYGANAVHFSVLQEYLAGRIGTQVGTLYQVSNNFHAYASELERLQVGVGGLSLRAVPDCLEDDRYGDVRPTPLVEFPETFDREVAYLLSTYETLGEGPRDEDVSAAVQSLSNSFLGHTVWPMLMAHRARRVGLAQEAKLWLGRVRAADWRMAATEWMQRRRRKS